MWFEILPSFGIVVVALAFPHASAYVINKLVVGNMYRRALYTPEQRKQYLRDRRITDDPYKVSDPIIKVHTLVSYFSVAAGEISSGLYLALGRWDPHYFLCDNYWTPIERLCREKSFGKTTRNFY